MLSSPSFNLIMSMNRATAAKEETCSHVFQRRLRSHISLKPLNGQFWIFKLTLGLNKVSCDSSSLHCKLSVPALSGKAPNCVITGCTAASVVLGTSIYDIRTQGERRNASNLRTNSLQRSDKVWVHGLVKFVPAS